MKACRYCGRENEDGAVFCAECGTAYNESLSPEEGIPALPLAKRLHELNAWSATAILLAYLVASVICVVLVGLIASLSLKGQGSYPGGSFESALQSARPVNSILIPLSSGIAMILVARILVRSSLRDTSAIGAAWVGGPWRNIIKGLAVGLFIAASSYTICMLLSPLQFRQFIHLERMLGIPGLFQVLNGVTIIVIGPFSEEILFRGVLYGGYRKSLGAIGAAVLTTGLFCLVHFPQVVHYPLLLLGLVADSLAALALRLSSGAVGPAIGVHAGYNTWFFSLALFRQYVA